MFSRQRKQLACYRTRFRFGLYPSCAHLRLSNMGVQYIQQQPRPIRTGPIISSRENFRTNPRFVTDRSIRQSARIPSIREYISALKIKQRITPSPNISDKANRHRIAGRQNHRPIRF